MATILITGGAGYIGSHCLMRFSQEGHDCVVFDNLSRGQLSLVKSGLFVYGDLLDESILEKVFSKFKFDAIVHLAALAYVGESVAQPSKYWTNNFVGSLNLIKAAINAGVKKIVFSSTCAVYGIANADQISESSELAPINPYGKSKLAVESFLDDADMAYGVKSVRFRYFNAAGATPTHQIGESHQPETHLIPLAIDAALGLAPAIKIYGDDYSTPDGTAIRDYIHVKDLADAHLLGLEHLLSQGDSKVLNLGTGQGHSVRQILKKIELLVGNPVPTTISKRRQGDPPVLVADPARAKQELGWMATHAIDEMLADAIDWHRYKARL